MIMEHDLAKELEDAGFPQGGKGTWVYPMDALRTRPSDRIYAPTLEELIEACGREFYSVVKNGELWRAFSTIDELNTVAGRTGQTPTIAVARLWLALNPKAPR
jgi:hypothetical protein